MTRRIEGVPQRAVSEFNVMAQMAGFYRALQVQDEIATTGTSSIYEGALADYESLSGKKPEERTPEENQRFIATRALLIDSFGTETAMISTLSVWSNARPLREGTSAPGTSASK